jgi:hypothetical protein
MRCPTPIPDNAGEMGQSAYPWRGRITISPAAGFDGSRWLCRRLVGVPQPSPGRRHGRRAVQPRSAVVERRHRLYRHRQLSADFRLARRHRTPRLFLDRPHHHLRPRLPQRQHRGRGILRLVLSGSRRDRQRAEPRTPGANPHRHRRRLRGRRALGVSPEGHPQLVAQPPP